MSWKHKESKRGGARDMDSSELFLDSERMKKAKTSGTICRIIDIKMIFAVCRVYLPYYIFRSGNTEL